MATEGSQRWYTNATTIALLSLVISLATAGGSVASYFMSKADEQAKRSITEVDRIHDPAFANSLSKIMAHAYGFIESGKADVRRDRQARFEEFWFDADADADMLIIVTRLQSIEQCFESRDCNRTELLSRFPEAIYQAIFMLRDYVFVDDELAKIDQTAGLTGWWMGAGTHKFLAEYCRFAAQRFGGMNLWSVKHERLMRPGQQLPDPCLTPRKE
ncbi:MAG: hypothetical protein AB7F35_30950 [Acetobacteraceae bacterium]